MKCNNPFLSADYLKHRLGRAKQNSVVSARLKQEGEYT